MELKSAVKNILPTFALFCLAEGAKHDQREYGVEDGFKILIPLVLMVGAALLLKTVLENTEEDPQLDCHPFNRRHRHS